MLRKSDLVCPYINKKKAAQCGTPYYCELDGIEFESMLSHCKYCEVWDEIIDRNLGEVKNAK